MLAPQRWCALFLLTLAGCGVAPDAVAPHAPADASVSLGKGIPGGKKCDSVGISPDAATLAPGDQLQLAATAYNKKGNAIPGELIQWQSSDINTAAVSSTGLVTAVAQGSADIQASCAESGAGASASITVVP